MYNLKEKIKSLPTKEFVKFCLVGGSGVSVDMFFLWLLADKKTLGINLSIAKFIAAEMALLNNFLLNNYWTFKNRNDSKETASVFFTRLLKFNLICGAGIILAVILIDLFHYVFHLNIYLSNLLSIGLVTIWNFGLNARYNWRKKQENDDKY
jgi:dolichol-phosphate mannosyltransferase